MPKNVLTLFINKEKQQFITDIIEKIPIKLTISIIGKKIWNIKHNKHLPESSFIFLFVNFSLIINFL